MGGGGRAPLGALAIAARRGTERVIGALSAGVPLVHGPDVARLPVGEGRAAVLVLEPGGWRVGALE